jgi:S-adenosylmethionine:tRNA ribosyltransferase-isomerase
MVVNDTRVIPARIRGKRGEGAIELTLHKRLELIRWRAFARPAKRLRAGDEVVIAAGFTVVIEEKHEAGEFTVRLETGGVDPIALLERHGEMPLPPYIRREKGGDPRDRADYQTIFARDPGAVAAPTAGLHFTDDLLARLEAAGIGRQAITLHVGAGTFLPVKAARTEDHVMHSEWGEISQQAAARINAARETGGRIVAIGTTSLRLLESAARADGTVEPFAAETDIFITPGYRFRAVDLLLTNFHLPRSTLFMLVSAFAGLDRMKAAYEHAKETGYRFYSYGDACLLHREDTP